MASLRDFDAIAIDNSARSLAQYRGKVVLVVNTASQCGFTPQYAGLESLCRRFHSRGFEILGFPCNQFGGQEKGDEDQIAQFCAKNYGVTFPMFAKVEVNGPSAHPMYKFLRSSKRGLIGSRITRNFTKFLVDIEGSPVTRYGSTTTPEKVSRAVETLLPTR